MIVQFAGAPALSGATGLASPSAATRSQASSSVHQRADVLRATHAAFRQQLTSAGIRGKVTRDYSQLLNAVAVSIAPSEAARLRALPGVAAVYPDQRMHSSVDADLTTINAPQMWQAQDGKGVSVKGAGENVAVIDTGVDYNHPDLGAGFGRGHKVAAGYDFANNDPDPMDDNGHGTHVAGIIAGAAAEAGGRTGVAPSATLTAYKVFGASGTGNESAVIAGLEAAVDVDNPYRATVVNMSLSGPAAPGDPLDQASEQATHAGVVVVAAAGNALPGASTAIVGSPAEAADVIAVGASSTGISVPTITVTSPVHHAINAVRMGLSANPPARGEDLDVVDVGAGDPSAYTGHDVTGKAVMFAYNDQQLPQLLATAEQHGAVAALVRTPNYYQHGPQPGPVLPDLAPGKSDDPNRLSLVATVINGTDATDISQWLQRGPVRIHVGAVDDTDHVAGFSAHGPAVGTYDTKPDLVAPGVEINSTWPGGGYADDSGTSMAAPHVAGAAALLRQAHPMWTASQISAALTSGAHLLNGYDAVTQGAGRLDIAASNDLSVLPTQRSVNFGLADLSGHMLRTTKTVTLTNVSTKARTLSLSVQPATAGDTHVDVTPRTAQLAPGRRLTVRLTLTSNQGATSADLTGWLRVHADGSPTLALPYLLAVRPLELHVTPDPTPADATVYIHSEPDLASAPSITVTAPGGRHQSATAIADQTGWWRYTVPAGPAGVYRVTATAATDSGTRLVGKTSYERLAASQGQGGSNWQSIGPDDQGAQEIGFTSQPGRMFAMPDATSSHAGVFRTDDNGATWHELRALPISDSANVAMATDPTRPGTVYLAVDGSQTGIFQGRILTSSDAGATWATLPAPDVSLMDLTIDPTGRILTAPGWDGEIYVSTDRGQTWNTYPSPTGTLHQVRVIGHDLYIADDQSLYVIRNIDGTPEPVRRIFTAPGDYQFFSNIVGDHGILVASTLQQLFISRDGGANWTNALTKEEGITTLQLVRGRIVAGTESQLWVSQAGGASWTTMPTPVPEDFFHVAAPDPGGNRLVVSAEGNGVFVTDDNGAHYHRIGITAANVHALTVGLNSAGHPTLSAGTTFSSFTTKLPEMANADQPTRDWGSNGAEARYGLDVSAMATDPTDPHIVYRAVANAQHKPEIDRSADGGVTWVAITTSVAAANIYKITVDPVNPDYLYLAMADVVSPGVLVSRDGGKTWRKNDLPMLVTSIVADAHNVNRIWLGGPSGLFRSDNQGQTITRLSSTPVSALALDPHDADHLVIGGSGLYDSRDGGRTLKPAKTAGIPLNVVALTFSANGHIYAADGATGIGSFPLGGRGVLDSRDSGRTWQNISAGLGNLDVESLATSPDGRWLYAGTAGGSVYRTATR